MIKVTHLTDKNIYHFVLPWGNWRVNGVDLFDNMSNTPMTSTTMPVIEKIYKHNKLTHWMNGDVEVSIEDYNSMADQLRSYGTWDDDDCEYKFEDIDDEYAYKKFIRVHTAATKLVTSYTPEELNVVHGMIDTGSEYIVPLFSVDSNKADLVQFFRNKLEIDTARKWADDNGVKLDIPTHSHLQFAKINDKYIFSNEFDGKHGILTVTPERANELLLISRNRVIAALKAATTNFKDSDIKVSELIRKITGIKALCEDHAYSKKVNRSSAFNQVAVQLRDLISDIEAQV